METKRFAALEAELKGKGNGVLTRIRRERAAVNRLITAIIRNGFTVAVDDGEEVHGPFDKPRKALHATMTTEEDWIKAVDPKSGHPKCVFVMIYGNGGDEVVADHSTNELAEKILLDAELEI